MAHFGGGRPNDPSHPSNQDNEHKKNAVLNQMLDLFLDSVEVEAIQSVLESCEYDYERSKKALQSISLKDAPKTTAVLPTTPSLSLPLPKHPEHHRIQHGNPKPAPPAVVNVANNQSPNKLAPLPPRSANPSDQTLERIHKFIKDGNKILVLMRGCPGSGKSHLAHQLLQWCGGERSNHVFSSDDYFVKNGKYIFNPQELQYAHKATQDNVLRSVRNSYSPVVVDNTNTQSWEMQVYVIMAVNHGYAVETLEPQTPWRFNHAQLVRRNVHNVPPNNIRSMLDRYEHGLTGEDIIKQLKLNYPPSKHPPQPARGTARRNSQCAASPVKSLRSPASFFQPSTNIDYPPPPYKEICSEVNEVGAQLETKEINQLVLISSEMGPSTSLAPTYLSPPIVPAVSLSLEDPANISRESSTSPVLSTRHETNDTTAQSSGSEKVEILVNLDSDVTGAENRDSRPSYSKEGDMEWGSTDWGEVLKQELESRNDSCRTDQRQRWLLKDLNYSEPGEKEKTSNEQHRSNIWDVSEPVCSWDILLQDGKHDVKEDLSQRKIFVTSKQDSSSNTNYQDFLLISNNTPITHVPPGMRVVKATSRNINEDVVNYVPPIPKKIVVDVSSMTDDESGSPVKGSLNELLRLFPHVSLGNLETLLETCLGDVNWASNCLLDTDSGVRLDVPALSCHENPSPEPLQIPGPSLDNPQAADAPRLTPVESNPRDVSQAQSLNKSLSQISLNLGVEENVSLRRCTSLPLVSSQRPTPQQISFDEIAPPTILNGSHCSPQHPNEALAEKVSSETPKEKPSLSPFLPDENEIKISETSDESETSSQDDDDMLEFVISEEFSQQLFSRFGGPHNKFRKSGLSPVLRIPESIACQIHYYLVLSQQEYAVDNEEEYKREEEEEEEESASDVQELFEQMRAEKPLTKQEREDMELAMAIYEFDLAAVYSKDTMATVLTRRLLKDTFPTLDPSLLDELMEMHGNSFHKTKEMIQEHYMNSYTVKQKDFPALRTSQTKTPSRNRSDISDRVRLRTEADGELHIARIYNQKAKEQSAKREWSAAAVYSQMAKAHKRQHNRNMELTVQRVLANNMQSCCPSSLDLHFMAVDEALDTLDTFLDDHILLLADTPTVVKSLYIITGRGKHSSGGVPKIRPAVLQRLDERYLENTLENPGLVKVKITSRSLLSHEQ